MKPSMKRLREWREKMAAKNAVSLTPGISVALNEAMRLLRPCADDDHFDPVDFLDGLEAAKKAQKIINLMVDDLKQAFEFDTEEDDEDEDRPAQEDEPR